MISGFLNIRMSTRNDGDLFYAIKDSAAISRVPVTPKGSNYTSFASILHCCRNKLNSGLHFPAVLGLCVLSQKSDKTTTLSLQDATGYAIINVTDCKTSLVDTDDEMGVIRMEGHLSFRIIELMGTEVVSASVAFEDVSVTRMSRTAFDEHNSMLINTAHADYQFPHPMLLS